MSISVINVYLRAMDTYPKYYGYVFNKYKPKNPHTRGLRDLTIWRIIIIIIILI